MLPLPVYVMNLGLATAPNLHLLPAPRVLEPREGVFRLPHEAVIHVPAAWADSVRERTWILDEALRMRGNFRLGIDSGQTDAPIGIQPADEGSHGPEGYFLEITPEGIRIQAAKPAGVFNAFATLAQIIEQQPASPLALPACRIEDSPKLAIRAVHIDMTCQQFTPAYVRSLMRKLAGYKVNAILMEYSDMFPFREHRNIRRPDAFSEQDVADIRRTAAECNQQIIPFLQCLGHLEYILHKDDYRVHGEAHRGYMLCPSDERTLPIVRGLIDDLLAQHPETKWLHVGGDEVSPEPRRGGRCERCAAYAEQHGFSSLYVQHYRQVAEYCQSKGVRPLMWSDMILHHPEAIEDLPRSIGFVVWDYGITRDPAPALFHGAEMGKLDALSPAYRKYFGEAVGLADAERRVGLVAFGHAVGFRSLGFDAFTGPAARSSGDHFDLPRFELHMANTAVGFLKAAEFGLPGAILTSWSYRGSPHEVCLPEYVCTAYGWNPDTPHFGLLMAEFLRQRYGINDTDLVEALLGLSSIVPATMLARPIRDDARDAWIVPAAAQLDQLAQQVRAAGLDAVIQRHSGWLRQVKQTRERWSRAVSTATRHRDELPHWELSLRHLEHRLALLDPLAHLAAVAAKKSPATKDQVGAWRKELHTFDQPRQTLRREWTELYQHIHTPRHLEVGLYNRFDAEQEMIDLLLSELTPHPAPAP